VGNLRGPEAQHDGIVSQVKNLVRELRAALELSQGALADALDVSRQTINAIETGRFDPSLPLAFKIARFFERSIEDVFLDETV
jgi:putative transcriptional regulator